MENVNFPLVFLQTCLSSLVISSYEILPYQRKPNGMPGFFTHEPVLFCIGFLSANGAPGHCSFPPAAHTAAFLQWPAQGAWWQSNEPVCNPPAQWRTAPCSDTGKAATHA